MGDMGSKHPKGTLNNVKFILFQPAVGPNGTVQDKMSLNTLLEAAKFLEMQEQRQNRGMTTPPPTATVRPMAAPNGASTHVQNGTCGTTQTFTLQPVKLLNATTTVANVQPQPTQTVVISSNNISSTILQGPISFAAAPPATVSAPPHNGAVLPVKKEQDGHISSTTMTQNQRRIMHNSFDIMNPLVIDETGPAEQKKYKQPPMVFRSGTREVHNKLEKCRRAHLKECFDALKKQLPTNGEEKKTSNLSILHSALKHIQAMKRRESELEHQLEQLAREKITNQQRLASLKKDCHFDHLDFASLMPEVPSSTSSLSLAEAATSLSNSPCPSTSSLSPSYAVVEPMKLDQADEAYCDVATSVGLGNAASVVTIPSPGMVTIAGSGTANVSSSGLLAEVGASSVINQATSVIATTHGDSKISIPILGKSVPIVTSAAQVIKEGAPPNGISVLPMPYPVNQGLVLQKVSIMPHKSLAPLVSTHFITTPQQLNGINGKVVPLTQYIMKPMVVVSSANQRPSS